MNEDISEPPSYTDGILIDTIPLPIETETIRSWFVCWLRHLNLPPVEISISISSANLLKQLNAEWRHKPETTDVLSFPQYTGGLTEVHRQISHDFDSKRPVMLGDIAASWDHAQSQAAEDGQQPEQALRRLLCHGFLHLLGYDHEVSEDEALRMKAVEAHCETLWQAEANHQTSSAIGERTS